MNSTIIKAKSKSHLIEDSFFICLMCWFPISAILFFTKPIDTVPIYVLLEVSFFIYIINKYSYSFKKLRSFFVVLLIWLMYLSFYYYHTEIAPPIPLRLMRSYLPLTRELVFNSFYYIALAIYVFKNQNRLYVVLYRLMIISSSLAVVLIFWVYIKEGLIFFIFDAQTIQGSNVTIITISYYLVFCCILSYYMINNNDTQHLFYKWTCFILSLIGVMILGKRGSLLSILAPILCSFVLVKKAWWQSILYILLFTMVYFIIIDNINILFDFFSIFSDRLAEQSKLAYYLGDNHGRDELWEMATDQFEMNTLIGYYPKLILGSVNSWSYGMHPHNIYLEALMTMGLIGSIPLFLYLVYILVFKVYQSFANSEIYCFFGLLLISELIHGIFSGQLYLNMVWPLLFVFAYKSIRSYRVCNVILSSK